MARGERLPDRTKGAVLFADISGFTPLTAALAQELGVQRGAEEVLNQINPVFEALIAQLHLYGGSVMGFAGDSITCWIDGDNGHRAVACALAMQEAMRPFATIYTPAGTPITLAIKVAVAVGPARRFEVGDPDIQIIDVLAGRTLDDVASAEKMAEKNEVVVTQQVIEALDGAANAAIWRVDEVTGAQFAVVDELAIHPATAPLPPLPPDALSEEQVRPWALAPVYRRLQMSGKYLAELRPSVALFLRFSGIDYDNDEDAGRKLDAYINWIQRTLHKHEGFLIQLTIGDKGSYVYASFGAPVAHDDDPERAVAAAMELRAPPAEFEYIEPVQIGISRGRVWAGECGARIRHTYGVMGNEVNMAARLMAKAEPLQILVRRRVAKATEHSFQYESLGLITVKGGAEPIPVAELVGRSESQAGSTSQFERPLVGRDAELALLERILDGALAGQGSLTSLSGLTGIGKSHLIHEFRRRASANGFQVATALCQRISQSSAYLPWRQILSQILGMPSASLAGQSAEEIAAEQAEHIWNTLTEVNRDWAVRIPLLGDLFGISIPDNPTTANLDPRQRQEALLALVSEILSTWASSQPLLLTIDNAHWMDEASQALVETVARALADAPILLLLSSRTENLADVGLLGQLDTYRHAEEIQLAELPSDGVEPLLTNLLGGQPSLLVRLLVEAKSQGNPFFMEELVDSLLESRQLVQVEGEWVLSDEMIEELRAANVLIRDSGVWVLAETADLTAVSLGIPDSVHGVILARIDRLPESHKPTLKVASVIGFSFELGLVAQVHPAHPSEAEINAQASMLEQRDFIFHDRMAKQVESSDSYAFRQQATQEVSYETLLYTQRRELHANVADLIVLQSAEANEQIAYHAFLGESWRLALEYQLRSGRRAMQLFANLQAIDHFQKAEVSASHLPASETVAERLEIHSSLGELLLNTGQYDPARDNLDKALELARSLDDAAAEAEACRWIARSYEMRGQYQPSLEWIDKGLDALGDALTPSGLEMRLISGLIYTRQGNYTQGRQQALACLLAAGEMNETNIVARSHSLLGLIDGLRGRASSSFDHFEEALTLYRNNGNLRGQAVVLNQTANFYFSVGQWSDAERYYRQAGTIFSQIGDIYNRLLVNNNLGGIALNQGRLDDALAFYTQALRSQEQLGGSLWVMGALHLNLGATHTKRGELERAFEHLETSRTLFDQAQVRDLLPEMHRRLAEAHLVQGDSVKAEEEIQLSLSLAEELSMAGERGHALRIIGRIAVYCGELDKAEDALLQAAVILEETSDEYGLAQARLALAQLYYTQERYEKGLDQLALSEPLLESLGATNDLESARRLRDELAQSQ